ncbi:hypothetical protein THAOC_27461, partial [Thalassiosira oceanica]
DTVPTLVDAATALLMIALVDSSAPPQVRSIQFDDESQGSATYTLDSDCVSHHDSLYLVEIAERPDAGSPVNVAVHSPFVQRQHSSLLEYGNAAGPAVVAPQMPARSPFPMTSLTAETANQDKPRALPDAEFDSPSAGEGAKTIPPPTKEDGAENRDFPG